MTAGFCFVSSGTGTPTGHGFGLPPNYVPLFNDHKKGRQEHFTPAGPDQCSLETAILGKAVIDVAAPNNTSRAFTAGLSVNTSIADTTIVGITSTI